MVQSVPRENTAVSEHSSIKFTYADYLLFPDDGLRHEIIGGEHYVTASPVTRHQRILLNLSHLIQSHLDTHPTGAVFFAPIDVLLSETDVVVPDLIYVSAARSPVVTSKNVQGAPDLVVEILSPSTRPRDERLKRDLYERAGVQEYWIVDPDRDVVAVHRRAADAFERPLEYGAADTLRTALMPGLALSIERVLA